MQTPETGTSVSSSIPADTTTSVEQGNSSIAATAPGQIRVIKRNGEGSAIYKR